MFFEAFDQSFLEDANIDAELELEKLSNMLILNFRVSGSVEVPCDRCGEFFSLNTNSAETVIVKFGDETYDETDELIMLRHDTHELDVSQRIYEMIVLNLPNKRAHKNRSDCNQDVLSKLDEINSTEEQEEEIDPRWEALKKLK